MGVIIPQVITEDKAGGAQIIDGGLRFDSSKSQYLSRTFSAGNRTTWTWSGWIKRSNLTDTVNGIWQYGPDGSNQFRFHLDGAGTITVMDRVSATYVLSITTSGVYRDASSWYHFLIAYDTSQVNASDRVKLYVNGSQVTSFSSSTYPSQNYALGNVNSASTSFLGRGDTTSVYYYSGLLSNVYFIDGQALTPSSFGFTDPLTNTWRPKKYVRTTTITGDTGSAVGFGTNGFYLPFDGNSPIGQDMSGKGNNWTPVNFGGSNTIEKATGALPILNTDGGGKVARVGVRTDSNASSLVLALPLVGIKSDFSNRVNSGTTEKAITVANAVASSAQSNFYGGSWYFDGTGDYVITNTSSDFGFGTGDFTLETWVYCTRTGDYQGILSNRPDSTSGTSININNTNVVEFQVATNTATSPNVMPTNKWVHLALTRSGTTCRGFIDGVNVATFTSNGNDGSSNLYNMGRYYYNSDRYYFQGYLQDVRIYKGLAKYTQNFIPASTDPDILPDTPSGVAYSSNVALVPSTDGGAVAFDGTGDYLSLASSADFQLWNSTSWTVEGWIYLNSLNTGIFGIGNRASTTVRCLFTINSSGNFVLDWDGTTSDTSTTFTFGATTGKWYHFAAVSNGTTVRVYRDGVQLPESATVGTSSQANAPLFVGAYGTGSNPASYNGLNGFLSNLHVVKGTALYTSNFTPPTAPITSVANTKLLCCKSQTSATVYDVSPGTITANGDAKASNFNPFTVNINTQRGQESGYATWNPLTSSTNLTNGNLSVVQPSTTAVSRYSTIGMFTGKWYWEIEVVKYSNTVFGVRTPSGGTLETPYDSTGYGMGWRTSGGFYIGGSNTGTGSMSLAAGDVLGLAFNADTGALQFYKNGILNNTLTSSSTYLGQTWHAGSQDSSGGNSDHNVNFGQKPFKFPPPTGFQPLALANTPRPTIVRPDQYVGVTTYAGTSGALSLTTGFKPDLVWVKTRGASTDHEIYDSVRGVGKRLSSNNTLAENNVGANGLTSFDTNGFTVPSTANYGINGSGYNYVAWAWKAGGNSNTFNINDVGYATASAAGLTAGTITPTGASVNTKSGFSIITYNSIGTSATIDQIPHGLGKAPAFYIVKNRDVTDNWWIYHSSISSPNNNYLNFTTAASTGSSQYFDSTSTIFGMRQGTVASASNQKIIAYLWAEIPGFSKFGSYVGNLSTDGPVVVCNFRPRWILIKRSTSDVSGGNWILRDAERSKFNPTQINSFPNLAIAETTEYDVDFLSNGFKIRSNNVDINNNGGTFIFAAFAETPSFNLYGGQANAR